MKPSFAVTTTFDEAWLARDQSFSVRCLLVLVPSPYLGQVARLTHCVMPGAVELSRLFPYVPFSETPVSLREAVPTRLPLSSLVSPCPPYEGPFGTSLSMNYTD